MSDDPNQPDYTPGIIPWNELITSDKAASVAFYSSLFGWTTDEMEMPNGDTYTLFKKGERMVAGCVTPPGSENVPTMWLSYVNVDDIDASIAKAKELGAVVHNERVDLPMGSFAVFTDPQGGTLAFWQGNPDADC